MAGMMYSKDDVLETAKSVVEDIKRMHSAMLEASKAVKEKDFTKDAVKAYVNEAFDRVAHTLTAAESIEYKIKHLKP